MRFFAYAQNDDVNLFNAFTIGSVLNSYQNAIFYSGKEGYFALFSIYINSLAGESANTPTFD